MIVFTCFGFLAAVHLAASSTQNPTVSECLGVQDPGFQITALAVSDAQLGKTVKLDGTVVVNRVIGKNPVLEMTFAKPDGPELSCIDSLFPCELKACNGTTQMEQMLNADWGNKCPVQPGNYTTHLAIPLPDNQAARDCLGDGNVVITFKVTDEGEVLGCGSAPVAIDVD